MQTKHMDSAPSFWYWDQYRNASLDRYLFRREHAFIRRSLDATTQPCRVLDIGCGSGKHALPLHDLGLDIVGLDIDPIALTAFKRHSDAVRLVRGDARHLPFADHSFGCVIAIQSLGGINDHQQFLRECHRVLYSYGILIFEIVNRRSYKGVLKRLAGRSTHWDSLSWREMRRATIAHGFDIQAVRGYNWGPFTRRSNSLLVDATALIEQTLRLDRLPSISPWVLVAARKR